MRFRTIAGKNARENSAAGEPVLEGGTVSPSSAGGTRSWAPVEIEINPFRRSIFEDVEKDLTKKGTEDGEGRT